MPVQINRDAFARTATEREKTSDGECAWCGRNGRRFIYATASDGGRRWAHRGAFCTKSCHDDYHGR